MRVVAYVDSGKHFPSSGLFLKDLLCKTGRNNNSDTIIILTHQPDVFMHALPANVSVQVLTYWYTNWPGLKWINKLLITRILKKTQAELFVTVNSSYVNRYIAPCCLIMPGIYSQPVKQDGKQLLKSWLLPTKNPDGNLHKTLQNATAIIVFSEQDGLNLQNKFTVFHQKIKLLPIDTAEEIRSLSWVEKENIKIQHTAGQEYFIFAGDIHQRYDLVSLLKAFSQFKRRQQSGMHLIIAGNRTLHTGQLVQKLASFKYRNDVHLVIDPPEKTLNALIGAAYAFVYPVLYDHLPVNVLSAICARVPVITFVTPFIKELAGDTVIYTASDAEALSESMQSVYKDEDLRAAVIDSAEKHLAQKGKTAMAVACRNLFQELITR